MTGTKRPAVEKTLALAFLLTALVILSLLAAKPAHAKTFTVNYTGDGPDAVPGNGACNVIFGLCSLRAAIEEANAAAGADTINFNIFGSGPHTIAPDAPLPQITGPVAIDGYSQSGASPNALAVGNNAVLKIELSGINAGPDASGLMINASNTTVKGLVINQWDGSGVEIFGSEVEGNKVIGNFIGTTANGSGDLGNGLHGVVISAAASDNTIGGTQTAARNIISGNDVNGVSILSAQGNQVIDNYIGTDKNGTLDLGNSQSGVFIGGAATNNTVGGAGTAARNVISGNNGDGVIIFGASAKSNKVMGNFVGTNASGTQDRGNSQSGIFISDAPDNTIGGATAGARNIISGNNGDGVGIFAGGAKGNKVLGNYVGTDKNGSLDLGNSQSGVMIFGAASDNTIGGTETAARNIISGNEGSGVAILTGAEDNRVTGNFIGTDVSGTSDLGNDFHGVRIDGAANNMVGGTTAAARNIISGNDQRGVTIEDAGATGNKVMGNYIGTDKNGTADLGNFASGVFIGDAPDNTVGGTTAGARNIISGNDGSGVDIFGASATGNHIPSNSINGNGELGIDLGDNGVTANDASDGDVGPNNLQNYPILTSAKTTKLATTIKGTLNSTASTTFTLRFFSSPAADPSGFGEGQKFKGSKSVTTNSSGNATFTFKTKKKVAKGQFVSATATRTATGDTSEFSLGKQVL